MSTFQRGATSSKISSPPKAEDVQLHWIDDSSPLKRDNKTELKVWKKWLDEYFSHYKGYFSKDGPVLTSAIKDDRYLEVALPLDQSQECKPGKGIGILIQNSCYCGHKCKTDHARKLCRCNDQYTNRCISKSGSLKKPCKCPQGHYGLKSMLKLFTKLGCSIARLYFNQQAYQIRSIFTENNRVNKSAEHLEDLRTYEVVYIYYDGHGVPQGFHDSRKYVFDPRTINSRLMFEINAGVASHVEENEIKKICIFDNSCKTDPPLEIDFPHTKDDYDKYFHNLFFKNHKEPPQSTKPAEERESTTPKVKTAEEGDIPPAKKKKLITAKLNAAKEGNFASGFAAKDEYGDMHIFSILAACVHEMFMEKDGEEFVAKLIDDETTFMEFCKNLAKKTEIIKQKNRHLKSSNLNSDFDYSIRKMALYPDLIHSTGDEIVPAQLGIEVLTKDKELLVQVTTHMVNSVKLKGAGGQGATTSSFNDTADPEDSDPNLIHRRFDPSDAASGLIRGRDVKHQLEEHFNEMKDDEFFKIFFKS